MGIEYRGQKVIIVVVVVSCDETDEPIEMRFGLWTCLKRGPGSPRERGISGVSPAMRPFVKNFRALVMLGPRKYLFCNACCCTTRDILPSSHGLYV